MDAIHLATNQKTILNQNHRFIDIRRRGKLLFKYDPEHRIISIRRNGKNYTVDLNEYARIAT